MYDVSIYIVVCLDCYSCHNQYGVLYWLFTFSRKEINSYIHYRYSYIFNEFMFVPDREQKMHLFGTKT